MKTTIYKQTILQSKASLLVLPIVEFKAKRHQSTRNTSATRKTWDWSDPNYRDILSALDRKYNNTLSAAIKHYNFTSEKDAELTITLSTSPIPTLIYLVCITKLAFQEEQYDNEQWRRLGGKAYQQAQIHKMSDVSVDLNCLPDNLNHMVCGAITEGFLLASYKFDYYKKRSSIKSHIVNKLSLLTKHGPLKQAKIAIDTAYLKSQATVLARDLVNTTALDMTPKEFVNRARKVCLAAQSKLKIVVISEPQLKKMGANALLSVARGSSQPSYLIHISYQPKSSKSKKRVVLIGKGVTFDSGGLSIKPWESMTTMKCDMAGAAAVLGVMSVISRLNILHDVHAIIPLAENMINGQASHPGDVVKALNGKTIEILNTDAEGRLILADALCYSKRFKPDIVVDIATLTGACMVALGQNIAGLYSDDETLIANILRCGKASGEKLWRMPLESEYRSLLASKIADIKNIGDRLGGSITAALFLKEFIPEGSRWAHLDIAGPAFVEKASAYSIYGASGFGVRLLLELLLVKNL